MFIPNTRAMWHKKSPKRTLTGREAFSAPRLLPVSVVSLLDSSAPTSVRADSSASRGAAEQHEAAATILVPRQFAIARGDVLNLHGVLVEVVSIQPRLDIFGKLDHFEVGGDIRASL